MRMLWLFYSPDDIFLNAFSAAMNLRFNRGDIVPSRIATAINQVDPEELQAI